MDPRVVILAAGASRRLGEPKALVDLPRGTPVVRLVRAATEATGERPLVVTGAHHAEIDAALASALGSEAPECTFNPDWDAGRTGGLQRAARLARGRDLCVLPVDHPRVSLGVLRRLLAAWAKAGAPEGGWMAPGFIETPGAEPRPGHPVVIGRALLAELATFTPDRPLRDLRAAASPVWMGETDEVVVIENLDTPEDLAAIRAADR